MATNKQLNRLRGFTEEAGIEVLGFDKGRGAHKKMRCRIERREFYILVTASPTTSMRAEKNFKAAVRRIRRAYDEDPEMFETLIRGDRG